MEKVRMDVAICDDEAWMLRDLEDLCRQTLEQKYELVLHSALSTGPLLETQTAYRIAVLDVELLGENGIDLARQLLQRCPACRIIFVSGFLHVVSQVYQVPHLGFVLKDQLNRYLPNFLLRAAAESADEANRILEVCCRRQWVQLPLEEICFLERRGHWTTITTRDNRHLDTREKLDELLDRISCPHFIRCHISYCVNLQHVQEMEHRTLHMDTGHMIPVSRPNVQHVRACFCDLLLPV